MSRGSAVKKIKRVADILVSKRVQASSSAKPATPTKKNSRPWEWRTPARSGEAQTTGQTSATFSQPLPALLSFLSSTLSPRSKRCPADSASDPPLPILSRHSTSSATDSCSCAHHGVDPAPLFDRPASTSPEDGSDDSDMEDEGEPDIQDGIDGSYHAVSATM